MTVLRFTTLSAFDGKNTVFRWIPMRGDKNNDVPGWQVLYGNATCCFGDVMRIFNCGFFLSWQDVSFSALRTASCITATMNPYIRFISLFRQTRVELLRKLPKTNANTRATWPRPPPTPAPPRQPIAACTQDTADYIGLSTGSTRQFRFRFCYSISRLVNPWRCPLRRTKFRPTPAPF